MSVTYLFQTVAKNTKEALIVALIKIVIHSCIQKKKKKPKTKQQITTSEKEIKGDI